MVCFLLKEIYMGEIDKILSHRLRAGFMRIKLGQKGFTLVEVIIVVAIVGILAAAVTPGIMASLARYRLRADVRELVINFKKAKLEAVKQNRNLVVTFTPGVGTGGSYQIAGVNPLSVQVSQGVWLTNVNFPADPLDPLTLPDNQTSFNTRGMVVKVGNFELHSSDNSKQYRIFLSTTGAVRIESSGDNGVTWSAQ